MGVSVLILGHSGSGKSTSLRNFEPDEIGIFNPAGKPLPFPKKLPMMKTKLYGSIIGSLQKNGLNAYVIDDANYMMAFENFSKVDERGYDKFTRMAFNFEQLLESASQTNDDTIVYFLMHPEYDETGRLKPKTIGKMLDNQLNVEGMFPIVLMAEHNEAGYGFTTANSGNSPVKAPMGMFPEAFMDNDLKKVDSIIREYWGMAPLRKELKNAE